MRGCNVAVVLSGFLAASGLRAEVPATMTYVGYLESGGQPVEGNVTAVFELYGAASAGMRLWVESYPQLAVHQGEFVVELGSTPEGALGMDLFGGAPLWLAVTINGTALEPRTALGSVPYAFRASVSDTAARALSLQGFDPATAHYQAGNGVLISPDRTVSLDTAVVRAEAVNACYDTPEEVTAALQPLHPYVQRAGDSMQGSLNVAGTVTAAVPTAASHLATKGYVDNAIPALAPHCTISAPSAWSTCNAVVGGTCGYVWGQRIKTITISCPQGSGANASGTVVTAVEPCSMYDSSQCG